MTSLSLHLASIDLEDWYVDVEKCLPEGTACGYDAFERQMIEIDACLDRTRTKCTFFVLGKTAERHPKWIKRLHVKGHEIASHGYGHDKVFNLSPNAFQKDLLRSVEIIHSITGNRPVGYRAPFFSITRDQFWIYDILHDTGFTYSSSVFPFSGKSYGIGDHQLSPLIVNTSKGGKILEIPMSVIEVKGKRIPVAGGGFWRAMPKIMIDRCVSIIGRDGRKFSMYLHPHEFDPKVLKSSMGWKRNLYVNLGRRSIRSKFVHILSKYPFGTYQEAISAIRF